MSYNKKVDVDTVLSTTSNNPVANKTITAAIPFKFGIDQSGNYGYIKDGADTVIPFKSQTDIDNAYNTGYNKGITDSSSVFAVSGNKVGAIGIINDGTYNIPWVIYTITGNTYQLFPMQNLGDHVMNSTDTNAGGYYSSEMYTYVHNTVLPNLKRSGLNITSCDLVSRDVYNDIVSKTGITNAVITSATTITGGDYFWLTDPIHNNSESFFRVSSSDAGNAGNGANNTLGVRPLITVYYRS